MSEFENRVKMLEELEVKFQVDYEYRGEPGNGRERYDLQIFTNVRPPFSPEVWCHLFMSEGDYYMGGCCGSMSHVQDDLCHAIRFEAGWFQLTVLAEIAEQMIIHDGEESTDEENKLCFHHLPKGETLEQVVAQAKSSLKNPWSWLALIWHITKDFYGPKRPHAFVTSELEQATSLLGSAFTELSLERLFEKSPVRLPPGQHKANRAMLLYRVLPAWKTLSEKIMELDLGSLEGLALIEKEKGPEAICNNGHGLCIYETQDEVDNLFKLWRQQDDEHKEPRAKPIDECFVVRKVRVSAEKGVEFLD